MESRAFWPTLAKLTFISSLALLSACGGQISIAKLKDENSSCSLQYSERVSSVIFSTFWGEGAEGRAVDTLDDNTSVLLGRQPFSARSELQGNLLTRLSAGDNKAPDVFQVNGGADVLQWIGKDSSNSQVCPLNKLDEDSFRSRYFSAALDPMTCNGVLYALPIGMHRVNRIYYNARLLELADQMLGRGRKPEAILDAWRTGEDFAEYLELVGELKLTFSKTTPIIPLAVGDSPAWPVGILIFDNLMASIPGLYEAVWQGNVLPDFDLKAALKRWHDLTHRSLAQSNANSSSTWREALADVENGRAIFTVIGDWASAELPSSGAHVQSAVFPPTRNRLIFTPDSIAVPRMVDEDAGSPARYFLTELVDNKSVMLKFSKQKSSIPPRSDLTASDLTELGDDLAKRYTEFRDCLTAGDKCEPLLAVSGYGPPPLTAPCFDEIVPLLLAEHALAGHSEQAIRSGAGGEGPNSPGDEHPATQVCPISYASTPEAIEDEVIKRLTAVSLAPPYRSYCPTGP